MCGPSCACPGGSDSNSDDGRSGSARNHVRRRNAEGDKGAGFQLSRWALGSDDEDANTGSGDAPLRKKGRKSAHPHVASLPERTLSAPKKNKKNLRVRWVDEEAEKEVRLIVCGDPPTIGAACLVSRLSRGT